MSEAEKKWESWDISNIIESDGNPNILCSRSREAYKAALRREIDREKAEALLSKNYSPKTLQTLDKVLSLLDTVEPTSESKEKPQ